jgi:DNA-binding NtrC family response regulator
VAERVLVVEDEERLREHLVRYLQQRGHEVDGFGSAEEALPAASSKEYDVALLDLRLPGKDGLSLAADLGALQPSLLIVMMTAYGTLESVIGALHAGVHDYLVKPLMLKDVGHKIQLLCEHRRVLRENAVLRRHLSSEPANGPVARSQAMLEVLAFARQVAASSSTVLIEGESGAGKEVVARYLHDQSPRKDGPFVAVNVTALPENLLESQLFGHEKGSFTGAASQRAGLFRAASAGTLFLDEIGDLPLPQQTKLLRAIEGKEIYAVGSDAAVKVDVRIVAATNADLARLSQEKRFRSDLYYRLSALKVRVPALRERPDDVPALACALLRRVAHAHKKAIDGFEPDAMRALLAYGWPGNVRELSNAVERAVVLCAGGQIGVAHLPPEIAGTQGADVGYQRAMSEFERALLRSTLEQVGGDRREAARVLGVSLATLYRRIDKLGIQGEKS